MITDDPRRTPSFILFANPNYYLDATNTFGCPSGAHQPGCVNQFQGDAYNHGDVAPEINRTWLGLAGPGVAAVGETGAVWSDHTDDRPTILALLGLRDDYATQGTVLSSVLAPSSGLAQLQTPLRNAWRGSIRSCRRRWASSGCAPWRPRLGRWPPAIPEMRSSTRALLS